MRFAALKPYNKPLIALTIPILVENFLRIFMGNVSVFLLSAWSDGAVAAVGVANQFVSMGTVLLSLVAGGAAVVISQSIGGGDAKRTRAASAAALSIALGLGIIVSVVLSLFAPFWLRLMDLEPELRADALAYMRVAGGSLLLQGMIASLSAICRSHARANLPMIAIVAMNVLHTIGTAVAVFVAPAPWFSGVQGVAWSFAISGAAALALMIFLVVRQQFGFSLGDLRPFPWRVAGEILRIGSGPGLESLSYNLTQILVTGFIAALGVVALSARTYVSSVSSYVYLVGMSLGQAAQLLIARFAGSGDVDLADLLIKRNILFNVGLNAAFSLMVLALWRPIFTAFTGDAAVLALILPTLLADLIVQVARGLGHCYNNALRAVGDIRAPILFMLVSIWGVALPLSYGLSLIWGLPGVWLAAGVDEMLRGLFTRFRWRSGKWKARFVGNGEAGDDEGLRRPAS